LSLTSFSLTTIQMCQCKWICRQQEVELSGEYIHFIYRQTLIYAILFLDSIQTCMMTVKFVSQFWTLGVGDQKSAGILQLRPSFRLVFVCFCMGRVKIGDF
jgi:hypothetical protein